MLTAPCQILGFKFLSLCLCQAQHHLCAHTAQHFCDVLAKSLEPPPSYCENYLLLASTPATPSTSIFNFLPHCHLTSSLLSICNKSIPCSGFSAEHPAALPLQFNPLVFASEVISTAFNPPPHFTLSATGYSFSPWGTWYHTCRLFLQLCL